MLSFHVFKDYIHEVLTLIEAFGNVFDWDSDLGLNEGYVNGVLSISIEDDLLVSVVVVS